MKSKKNATEETKPVAEDSCTQTETSLSFEEACKRFRESWEQMSEVERNRIAEEETPISPEEEKYIHEEAIRTWERIEKRNAIYKHGEEAVTRSSGMGMKDMIAEFKTGRFVFVDANVLSDKDWAKFNKVLWDRESVRFVLHQDKMRLTQVRSNDILKKEEEDYIRWFSDSSFHEPVEKHMNRLKKQDEEFMAIEKEMLENPSRETYPCKGFDLPTAEEAHEHFRDKLTELIDYGDFAYGHRLCTGADKGKRILCRCSECGGLILIQQNESFFDHDDYFPVRSHWEADQLNKTYDGIQIEQEWNGKWLSFTRNKVTGHNWGDQ